jgi:hypothetical protein
MNSSSLVTLHRFGASHREENSQFSVISAVCYFRKLMIEHVFCSIISANPRRLSQGAAISSLVWALSELEHKPGSQGIAAVKTLPCDDTKQVSWYFFRKNLILKEGK